MARRDYLDKLMRDLESHTEVRRFGSGWLSLPKDRWPENYGIPEDVPRTYWSQFLYPWTRKGKTDEAAAE